MIIDIVIILCWFWIACSIFGVNPMIGRQLKKLPPVKRRRIAGERRKRDRLMLREIEADEERQRNDALRALTPADVAFLSAGGHWTPPESVRERMRQKEFELREHTRQLTVPQRAPLRSERTKFDGVQHQLEERAARVKLRAIGMSVDDLKSAYDRPKAKPYLRAESKGDVALTYAKGVASGIESSDVIESADGTRFEIVHYNDGTVVRRDLPNRRSAYYDEPWH